ncbi:site-2 protease family protein [Chitinimonas arctica]|uniref:Site-2 protease family protein n=1 Tax=Chitinimonas arctica TaxID=2594795 RepID=A0A516SC63_9NEIS|nr:site-2 protease family protein [Chitinimonas arctica]QDQ25739.1 site-2 protease family protein [Chitinimonas arctica]
MDTGNWIAQIAVYAIPVLLAITVHEAAHGYVAKYFGDNTAEREGRLSLNPLRHIEPIGTVLVPLLTLYFGNFLFGWAKPVPVVFEKLRHPKADMLWVAAAGPASNLLMLLIWGIVLVNSLGMNLIPALNMVRSGGVDDWLANVACAGVRINMSLMLLNLLPLPPLDGGRILISLLPDRASMVMTRVEPFGVFILVALIATNTLSAILGPLMLTTYKVLDSLL